MGWVFQLSLVMGHGGNCETVSVRSFSRFLIVPLPMFLGITKIRSQPMKRRSLSQIVSSWPFIMSCGVIARESNGHLHLMCPFHCMEDSYEPLIKFSGPILPCAFLESVYMRRIVFRNSTSRRTGTHSMGRKSAVLIPHLSPAG